MDDETIYIVLLFVILATTFSVFVVVHVW